MDDIRQSDLIEAEQYEERQEDRANVERTQEDADVAYDVEVSRAADHAQDSFINNK